MRRKGKQADLKSSLNRLVAKLDRTNGGAYRQSRVAAAWAGLAGDSVLAHTTGAHLREGELVVYVDSPLWATELSALAEQYRAALNTEIGEEIVRSVRFTVSRKVGEQQRFAAAEREAVEFYSKDKVAPVPLSPNELEKIEASTASIDDQELREAVVRATVADMQWKKGLADPKDREKPREGA